MSNPAIQAEGVVREISPVADPATRTFQVKVTLKNPPEQMRFGGERRRPRQGLDARRWWCCRQRRCSTKAGSRPCGSSTRTSSAISLKAVAVARYETDRVDHRRRLAKGDIVVTAGVNRLRENQKVRLAEGARQ